MFRPPQVAFKLPNIKHRIARIGRDATRCSEIQRREDERTLKRTFHKQLLCLFKKSKIAFSLSLLFHHCPLERHQKSSAQFWLLLVKKWTTRTDVCMWGARRGAAAIIHEFSCKKTPPPRQPRCFEYFNSRGRFNFSRFPSQTSRNSIQTNPLPPVVFQRNLNLFQCARWLNRSGG